MWRIISGGGGMYYSIVDLLVIVYGIYKTKYINLLCPKLDLNINNGNQIEIDSRVQALKVIFVLFFVTFNM